MSFEFKLPDLGEGITEGEIVKWHVKEGDSVEEHQVVLEIETDKAIVEVPSPKKGRVEKLNKAEGDTVNVGETLLTIDTAPAAGKEVAKEAAKESAEEAEAGEEAREPVKPEAGEEAAQEAEAGGESPQEAEAREETPGETAGGEQRRESVSVVGSLPDSEEVLATPKVRSIAKKRGIDLAKVKGTGPGGVIREEDLPGAVEAEAGAEEKAAPAGKPAAEAGAPKAPAAAEAPEAGAGSDRYGEVVRVPIKGVRRAIARNLIASQKNAASVTGMDEADVTELWELREREGREAKARGVHLTFLPFFMKAVRHALEDHPMLNGSVDESGEMIIVKKYFNIGVAVDTPDGLMVAVVRDADKKTILELGAELMELSEKARARKITLDELKGSTFTISNYGSFGGVFATPIINPPDIAILGTGRITEKPWIKDGKIVIRRILPLSLTFDHRIVDGVEAARFLAKVVRYLEDPARIFIESA